MRRLRTGPLQLLSGYPTLVDETAVTLVQHSHRLISFNIATTSLQFPHRLDLLSRAYLTLTHSPPYPHLPLQAPKHPPLRPALFIQIVCPDHMPLIASFLTTSIQRVQAKHPSSMPPPSSLCPSRQRRSSVVLCSDVFEIAMK